MLVAVEMEETEIREALAYYLMEKYGVDVDVKGLSILVHSKQNWKSDWEEAHIKVSTRLKGKS